MADGFCSASQCFLPAAMIVVPCGKWRNMQPRPVCRGCAGGMAVSYKTPDGKGWAEVYSVAKEAPK